MLIDLARVAFAWLFIFPALFGYGQLFRAWVPTKDIILSGAIVLAAGAAILSFLIVFLDQIYVISQISVWSVVLFGAVLGARAHESLLSWIFAIAEEVKHLWQVAFGKLFLVIAFLSIIGLLLGTLSPEIGGDALCYHLNVPKLFLRNGSLEPLAFDYNSFFPAFMYNLYLTGLATGGMFAAKLFHYFLGLLVVLILQRYLFISTKRLLLSVFAGLALLLTPGIYNQLSTSYVDVALGLYTTLSIIVLHFSFERRLYRGFALAGFFLGCAISIKYLAMMAGFGIAAVWLYAFGREKLKVEVWLQWLSFTAGFVVSAFYWLLRNWLLKGNPFFPYFGEWFGGAQRPPQDYFDLGMGKSVLMMPAVFWNMFFHPNAFGAFSNRIGAYYLLLFPFMLFAVMRFKKYANFILFSTVFFVSWFYLVQADRWIYPMLPMFALVGSVGMHEIEEKYRIVSRRYFGKIVGFLAILFLTIYLLGGIYHYRYAFKLYAGQSQASYLKDMERTYPIAEWINNNLDKDVKILVEGEPSKYYIDRELLANRILKVKLKYHEMNWSVEAFHEFVRSKGVTHVLVSQPIEQPIGDDETLLRRWVNSSFATLIKKISSENIRDAKHEYFVYRVNW